MRFRVRTMLSSPVFRTIEVVAATLTVLSILVSTSFYLFDRPARQRESIYVAWQVLETAEGRGGSGGRERAILQLKEYGEDLSGLDLSSGFFRELDLTGVTLRGGTFEGADLPDSKFNHMSAVSLSFRAARVHRGQFIGSKLDSVDFSGAVIGDANWHKASVFRSRGDSLTSFNGSEFSNARISNSEFPGTNFDNCVFSGAYVVETRIPRSRLRRCILEGATWINVDGREIDLALSSSDRLFIGGGSDLREGRFDGSTIRNARFEKVNLSKASFFRSDLSGSTFVDSDLSGTDFSSANLRNVEMRRCDTSGVLFRSDSLMGLNVTDCFGKSFDVP